MTNENIVSIQKLFNSRLDTLKHLIKSAQLHLGKDSDSILEQRVVSDMLPFSTQILFTCNQPRNFALWSQGKEIDNLDIELKSLGHALQIIEETKALVMQIDAQDSKLDEIKRIGLGEKRYAELTGIGYVNEFLMPNFYFHLVTAYGILRMAGVPVGKRDYMMHLIPFVKED